MEIPKKVIVPSAIVLGIASGLVWFVRGLGDYLEYSLGNFLAWGVCPAFVPFVAAILLFFVNSSATYSKRAVNSLLFFGIYYAVHWWPMWLLMLALLLGGRM